MAFLHGVEVVQLNAGPRSIQTVASSIIALVGIAPKGDAQTPVLVLNDSDAAKFGARLPGFTIPEALDSILKQGTGGTIFVVNVFNEATHAAAIANEVVTVADNKFKLAFAPVGATPPNVTNTVGDTTFVAGTDYTIDEFGNGVKLSASLPATIHVDYKKLDISTVSDSNIIGTVDGTTEARTGLKCLDLIYNMFGVKPKIVICPGFSHKPAVSVEMRARALSHRAIALLDAPEGTTATAAIAGRGIAGTFGWNISDDRAPLLFPKWKKSNPDPRGADGSTILEWYSALLAGVIATVDNSEGYWVSPSNKTLQGVVGPERQITCSFTDPTAQNQLLNAAGIVTYLQAFGTGLRTWGNRSSLYPSDTAVKNFIPIRRTVDILLDSVEIGMLPYIDQPINRATIDAVKETVNALIRTLVGRGALIEGSSCTFDPNKNPPSQIAAGNIVFDINVMGPTPAEKITFNAYIDINLLSNLTAQ
jgi:phage tail sheath protein FI